jgi:predicted dehydrogenase
MYDRARSGGGVVANVSSHLLFVLRRYFGMPSAVQATSARIHTAVEDELRATFAAPGCPEVTFESSWSTPGYPLSVTTIAIEGARGTLRVRNDGLELELREPRGGFPLGTTSLGEADLPQPARFLFNGEAYALEDAHALRWMTGGPAAPITVDAALDVQRMMEALYASAAANGRPVPVPQ